MFRTIVDLIPPGGELNIRNEDIGVIVTCRYGEKRIQRIFTDLDLACCPEEAFTECIQTSFVRMTENID